MIHLKVKGTFKQINDALEKLHPVMVNVLTLRNEPQTYYLTINEPNEVTAKLIVQLSLANITMMGTVKGLELKQLLSLPY